jgi:uncharacterized membrane protein YfcA
VSKLNTKKVEFGGVNQINEMKTNKWKSYVPTAVLLLIIVGLTVWSFFSGNAVKAGSPNITLLDGILLLVVGLLAGMLGGIIGTGGCSVMLPMLHFWLGYPAPIAIGTTLFAVIFTAISGGFGHLVRGNLDKKTTFWLGSFGIVGVFFGSWLFNLLTTQVALLGLILGLAFLLPAFRMSWEGIMHRKKLQKEGKIISASKTGVGVFGFIIGVLTGLVGLGGGYALVPGLIYLFGAPVYITMGTSLATMIPLAIVGGSIKFAQGFVAMGAGLLLATGTIIGAQIGAAIIKRFKPTTLKLIFGVYFLYVSIKFIAAYFGINIW